MKLFLEEKKNTKYDLVRTISNGLFLLLKFPIKFNKQIKKYTKRKEQFPNEEALERFLVSRLEEYNQRFATRCHIGFDQARAEIADMFKTTD